MAYSTWKRRPSGEKVFTPRSYSLLQRGWVSSLWAHAGDVRSVITRVSRSLCVCSERACGRRVGSVGDGSGTHLVWYMATRNTDSAAHTKSTPPYKPAPLWMPGCAPSLALRPAPRPRLRSVLPLSADLGISTPQATLGLRALDTIFRDGADARLVRATPGEAGRHAR